MSKKRTTSKQKKNRAFSSNWLPLSVLAFVFIGALVPPIYMAYQNDQKHDPALKTEFQHEFPGLEKAGNLRAEKRQQVIKKANEEFCPCGCGYTLASCLKVDLNCPRRLKNLAWVHELIREIQ